MTDPIAALGEIDPSEIDEGKLAELLDAASGLTSGPEGGLGALRPEQFSRLLSRATSAQINAVLARPELRARIVDEVFRRMGEHYRAGDTEAGAMTESCIAWRIGTSEDDYLRYECVLSGGTCTVTKQNARGQNDHEPRVTIMLASAEFLKLASGNASPFGLFMSGQLKVAGDLGFAAGLGNLFSIPRA